jgi:hypothetical protein
MPDMNRRAASDLVRDRIGNRRLVWFGRRGEDAQSLLGLEQFAASYSLTAPLKAEGLEVSSVKILVESLAAGCEVPSVLLPYRPYGCLTSLDAARVPVELLAMSYEFHCFFMNKPQVEEDFVRSTGIASVPWRYLERDDERRIALAAELTRGPIVVRASVSSSGEGHELIRDAEDLATSPLVRGEELLSVAPYLPDLVSLNLGCCVFEDGGVTLHAPSVQLIGLASCTRFPFGYCGNDFAAVKELERGQIGDLEVLALAAGRWLHRRGYVGAFGIDAAIGAGELLFMELNARFQGSSRMSVEIDLLLGLPDIYLDHMMASFGMESYDRPPLGELVLEQAPRSQIFCHASRRTFLPNGLQPPEDVRPVLVPGPGVRVAPDSVLFGLGFETSVTTNGRYLLPAPLAIVEDCRSAGRLSD